MSTTAQNPLLEIEQEYGQSIWMDNLSRDLLTTGELAELIDTRGVLGITSNPAIFEKAIAGNAIYDNQIEAGIEAKKSLNDIYESLIFTDIRHACDILRPVYDRTNGIDGYVSIEVPPTIAADTASTITEARRYYGEIDRSNVMIKIPGTPEGLPAVEQMISEGISVNVTLLFSVASYVESAWAYIRGLETRAAQGDDISNISSVASFFLSRIDTNIDAKLDQLLKNLSDPTKTEKISALKGKIAIANAKVAYQEYKKIIATDRWQQLAAKGARVQRLLWASTGTKDPSYSDVMYVDGLVGPDTVNTLPPNTIEACADHCDPASRIEAGVDEAYRLIASLKDPDVNIDLDSVMGELLIDGIDKFVKPFDSLMKSLDGKVKALMPV
ncbi:transaldolase [Chamaesiphon sp.]|uniref:transaldolase n=1 Tax=Chamaesiphon sp. TaxID=2814140 RepID=UPI0035937801